MTLVAIALLGLLLAFPAMSVEGACNGLRLWFQVVLPTLAPFIICTQTVVALGGVNLLILPFYPLSRTLFGLSKPGAYVLLCGLLCGYPLGAKMCSDFLSHGKINRAEADFLLSVCNHPSPMFLLGFVRSQLNFIVSPVLLLTCLYLPVLPVSILSRNFYKRKNRANNPCHPILLAPAAPVRKADKVSIENIMMSTCETMVIIGGYMMLFSILVMWIQHLTFLPLWVRAMLTGIAEITTGVNQLCMVMPKQRALLPVIALVSLGGLSGIFQTRSVIKSAGLSIRHYTLWKIIHTGCSIVVFILLSPFLHH